ncbi:gamma-glutamyltransferase family protein [Bacilliculturomica massiliensis]|uniref:gamma-glutamyltransferase family protein n=1 Tax=Bacilliculturomica massiliensis TaxID=1917867 RepID=UPI001031627A|nr:gamma-glutamyltransferase family protein [Bacilliculturomica massiliensis]
MRFDSLYSEYPTRRSAVFGKKGMVCTSQPLAAQAGLDILKRGGNAVDAAVAAAACLTVVEPTSNGIGGDAFALVWMKERLHGLNASGPAPAGIDAEALRAMGYSNVPQYGWIPVTVPGAPSAWAALSKRFGRLPFEELLKPAIGYAEEGFPVSPVVSRLWDRAFGESCEHMKDDFFRHWFETFAPEGRAPRAGEVWSSADHGRTLRRIAESGGEDFYRGGLAEEIDSFSRAAGGFIRKEDLAQYQPQWTDPISVNYRGYDVWELPPNGHGMVALMALNILNGYDFTGREREDTYHYQIEALKSAFADGLAHIADPGYMEADVAAMLSETYADQRRSLISDRAAEPCPGKPEQGGTVYLCTADGDGNMVSYIQSNYMGFGSGLVVPGTGIALHNRGCNFSLKEGHPNCLAPGKRPYHTIIPGFMTRDGKAVGPFGVMGGFMQPQGHVQMVMNAVDFHMDPQEALSAPRWQWTEGRRVAIEREVSPAIVEGLIRRGHQVTIPTDFTDFGRGQIIWRTENGVLVGGSEPRTDGVVAAW